jgi:Lar family restriction alleviation protein
VTDDAAMVACPFCGHADVLDVGDKYGGELPFAVSCGHEDCGFIGPAATTREEAVALWNQRREVTNA